MFEELGYFHLNRVLVVNIIKDQNMFLPEQEVPFPVYPVLQAHVNDPAVFVQAALLSQLWVFREHSSLSKKKHYKI